LRGHKAVACWKLSQGVIRHVMLLGLLCFASFARGEVEDIVVGIVPTCPYGISACWAGAHEALSHLDGVASVDQKPDSNTCTAHIRLKSAGLPNPEKLRAQFELLVGKVYIFRGINVTVLGDLKQENGSLTVQLPESKELLRLASLHPDDKLQWNFKDQRPHGTKLEEQNAYQQVIDTGKQATTAALKTGAPPPKVRVTGRLKMSDQGPTLEVQQFSIASPSPSPLERH